MAKKSTHEWRILAVLKAAKAGEKLCKCNIGAKISWSLEPSGRAVEMQTAEQIIAAGLLIPQHDGLFGDDTSQTWGAT